MIRRLLHPTDFSRVSAPAFAAALRMANENRAELRVVHVVAPVTPVLEDSITLFNYERLRTTAQADARKRLSRLVGRARASGVRATGVLREGVAWSEIVSAARSPKADLIVIGTHGRTGLPRLLLGSVAARVIGLAKCPVRARWRGARTGT